MLSIEFEKFIDYFLKDRDFHVGKALLGTVSFLNLDALEHFMYSKRTDMWGLACAAFRLEQKTKIVPAQPNVICDRLFFADAIRNGVVLSRQRRRPYLEVLGDCKTLWPILKLLTQESVDMTGFLLSDQLKTKMQEYGLKMQGINQGALNIIA